MSIKSSWFAASCRGWAHPSWLCDDPCTCLFSSNNFPPKRGIWINQQIVFNRKSISRSTAHRQTWNLIPHEISPCSSLGSL